MFCVTFDWMEVSEIFFAYWITILIRFFISRGINVSRDFKDIQRCIWGPPPRPILHMVPRDLRMSSRTNQKIVSLCEVSNKVRILILVNIFFKQQTSFFF